MVDIVGDLEQVSGVDVGENVNELGGDFVEELLKDKVGDAVGVAHELGEIPSPIKIVTPVSGPLPSPFDGAYSRDNAIGKLLS